MNTVLLWDVDQKVREEAEIARKMLEVEFQGADLFRGYTLSVLANVNAQTFKLDKLTIPVKLKGLTVIVPSGGNAGDLLSLQIADPNNAGEFLESPIQNVAVGQADATFRFRRGHPIPAFSQISAIWTNSIANVKTVVIGAAYVRDQGGKLDRI